MCDRVAFVRAGRVESVLVASAGAAVAHGLVIRVAGPRGVRFRGITRAA